MTPDPLADYHRKRHFDRTPEPRGSDRASRRGEQPMFVIQKHAARRLHYDFRLEIDGVLVSWAVPKGPSTNPSDKRLAVRTEDHPLAYADFEGVIAEGYGAGTVLVWDTGAYVNLKDRNMRQCLEDGRIEIGLVGSKLHGGYALVHTQMRGDPRNWLLIKMKDDDADARRNPVASQGESVLSGRSLEDISESET